MVESSLINFKNKILEFSQNKFGVLVQNSVILAEIDKIILFFITLTVISTTFAKTDTIGLFALITIGLTIVKLFTIKGQRIELTSWDGALLIYLLFCIISTINSTLLHQSLYGLSKTVTYLGFYFSALQYLRYNPKKIYYFLFLIAGICSIESIIGIIQQHSGVMAGATWQDTSYLNPEDVLTRVFGTLKPYNPNLYGGYLIATIPSVIALAFLNRKWKMENGKLGGKNHSSFLIPHSSFFIWLVLSALSVLAVFCSGCRGAYLGLGAIVITMIFLSGKWKVESGKLGEKNNFPFSIFHFPFKAIGLLAAISAAIMIFMPAIAKRILSIFTIRGDTSSSFRMNVYHSAFEMLRDNRLFGIGVGNKVFREIYGLYMVSGFDALSAYCVLLEIGVESGIFAALAFLSFLVLILANGIRFLQSGKWRVESGELEEKNNFPLSTLHSPLKIIAACCMCTIIGVMVHGLVDTVFFRPQIQIIFWLIVAILSVCVSNKEKWGE